MPLPSFLQRFRRDAARGASVSDATPLSSSDVEATRVRARRRLIGMVVLVGAGVIGFPVLFETQPRPMSGDVQIVQASVVGSNGGEPVAEVAPLPERGVSGKVAVSGIVETPAQEPAPEPAPKPIPEPVASEEVDNTPPVVPVPKVVVAEALAKADKPEPAIKPAPKEAVKNEPKATPAKDKAKDAEKEAVAKAVKDKASKDKAAKDKSAKDKGLDKPAAKDSAKPNDKSADKSDKAASNDKGNGTRYVVQFGAFSDVPTAHEARMKVERLGLRTYTQQVDTPAGKRIRVRMGPYADKAEADKAMATLRKAGLTGAVLTL